MTLDALKKAGVPVFAYGNFITVAVNFIILAFIIFMMVKQINRLRREAPAAPLPRPSPPKTSCCCARFATASSAEIRVLTQIKTPVAWLPRAFSITADSRCLG